MEVLVSIQQAGVAIDVQGIRVGHKTFVCLLVRRRGSEKNGIGPDPIATVRTERTEVAAGAEYTVPPVDKAIFPDRLIP